jgi:tripartite-type tricarboxylate transporter receptor subunit TctC
VSYLPDIPTAAEAGLPGYEVTTWFALFAPKGTPHPIVEWLNAAVREMNADQVAVRRLTDVNIDPMSMTVDQFGAQVRADAVRWEGIIRDAGLKPE